MQTKKPWYKSKLFLLGLVMALVGGTDLATGWLSGNGVTPEQIQVIDNTLPQLSSDIKAAIQGKNYFGVITTLSGFLGMIWRKWFTKSEIE